MEYTNARVGIWGFGIVGTAALPLLAQYARHIGIFDKKPIDQGKLLAHQYGAQWYDNLALFLEHHDLILPSPGIDLRPYNQYQHKWLAELDIFYDLWQKPIIAITGSVGKTSTTQLLNALLVGQGARIALGGNIGIGALALINQKSSYDCALLEVSSFQLELCKRFAPDLALWTNFHANHLDRHGTIDNYLQAKLRIIEYQRAGQHALLPAALAPLIKDALGKYTGTAWFHDVSNHASIDRLYTLAQNNIIRICDNRSSVIAPLITNASFVENIVVATAAVDLSGYEITNIESIISNFHPDEHRLELVKEIDGIAFYNDSKSTIAAATLAAVEKLYDSHRPLILILGGIGKGVDRSPMITQLRTKVNRILTFGAEAASLTQECMKQQIPTAMYTTLDELFADLTHLPTNAVVLLSPAGASYDLYSIYTERGIHFRKLVEQFRSKNNTTV